jgi:hypothetical protein
MTFYCLVEFNELWLQQPVEVIKSRLVDVYRFSGMGGVGGNEK